MGLLKKAIKWGAEHPVDNKLTRKLNEKTQKSIEKSKQKLEIQVKEVA